MYPGKLTFLAVLLLAPAAQAAVTQSSPDGAVIEHRFQIAATAEAAWHALVHPELWWPADHTWSGSPGNLRLQPEAGQVGVALPDDMAAQIAAGEKPLVKLDFAVALPPRSSRICTPSSSGSWPS